MIIGVPKEIKEQENRVGAGPTIVAPGVRMAGQSLDDQQRVRTPREAMDAGADYIVIGRPITRAPDPGAALEEVIRSLSVFRDKQRRIRKS